MPVEDVLDDGEPEAGAAGGAGAALVDPVETLGEPRQVLQGDALAVVRHAELGAVRVLLPADAEMGAGRGVVDGIMDQVGEGAAQFDRIAHEQQVGIDGGLDPVAARAQCLGLVENGLQFRGHVHGPMRSVLIVHLQPREGQQVVDDGAHAPGLVLHECERLAMVGRGGRGVREILQKPGNDRERGAQFMRGVGHEVAPDHVQVIEVGHVPRDQQTLALVRAEGGDAQGQREGAVVLGGDIQGVPVFPDLDEVGQVRLGEQVRQPPALVPWPVDVEQGGGGGVGPFDALQLVQDDQGVRQGVRRLAEAADEADLALASPAPVLLIVGNTRVDFAPESGRVGWGEPLAVADQVNQAEQSIEVTCQVGQRHQWPGPGRCEAREDRPGADPNGDGKDDELVDHLSEKR